MGADNWGICPKCKERADIKQERLEQRLISGYGKLPEAEYLELREKVSSPPQLEPTMREDYELGTDSTGAFYVRYRASCNVCGFSYKFQTDENVLKDN